MLFILDDLPGESDCWGLLKESKLLLLHDSAGLAVSQRLPVSPYICWARICPWTCPWSLGLWDFVLRVHYQDFNLPPGRSAGLTVLSTVKDVW